MRAALVIAKREIDAFYVSPIAWVVLTVWLLYQGMTFYLLCMFFASQQYSPGAVSQTPLTLFFGGTTFFFIPFFILTPVLTMRLLAEEHRSGTIEMLLTAPVSDVSVVAGKYIAAMIFWCSLWLPTGLYVVILSQYGDVDLGVVGACYLGVLGIGLHHMALGLLMSTVSRSQIVAAALTFLVLGALFLLGIGSFLAEGVVQEAFNYVSVWTHMEAFAKGIVDTRYLVFDVSITVLALFLAVRVLEGRRYTK